MNLNTPSLYAPLVLVGNHRTQHLALVHRCDRLRNGADPPIPVCHILRQRQLAAQVLVDEHRHVGARLVSSEGGALPGTSRDELEGARRDLLAGGGDADDSRDAPATVGALERRAHHLGGEGGV